MVSLHCSLRNQVKDANESRDSDGLYGSCYSDIKLKSLGASSAFTRIYCDWTGSHQALTTSVYEILPASGMRY